MAQQPEPGELLSIMGQLPNTQPAFRSLQIEALRTSFAINGQLVALSRSFARGKRLNLFVALQACVIFQTFARN